jgi:outer membrane lipoprotein LolB
MMHIKRQLLGVSFLLLVLLQSGCASMLPTGGKDTLQSQLNKVQHWQVRGKMSVRTPDDSATGYLDWKQNKREFDIYIAGPLGQGATRLSGDKDRAELTLPGWDSPRDAKSPEELMLLYLGWNFPVSDIRYWVKGQPSPGAKAVTEFDDTGLLSKMIQHGWEITYKRYSRQNGYWLPGLVKVSGHDFRFTFSIREWTLHD